MVYKQFVDGYIYVIGDIGENEVMLYQVVLALKEALEILLKGAVDKRNLLENYDLLSIAIEETVDDG